MDSKPSYGTVILISAVLIFTAPMWVPPLARILLYVSENANTTYGNEGNSHSPPPMGGYNVQPVSFQIQHMPQHQPTQRMSQQQPRHSSLQTTSRVIVTTNIHASSNVVQRQCNCRWQRQCWRRCGGRQGNPPPFLVRR